MAGHAFLSASGAPAWLLCNLKPWMEKDLPDSSSKAADEGTAAHELGERCLNNGTNPAEYIGEYIAVGDDFWEVTNEMAEYVDEYVKRVRERPGDRMVEVRLDIGFITGEEGAQGTADCLIFDGSTMYIGDLKYGYGFVPADSSQLIMYAAAAVRQFSTIYDVYRVVLQILQPRINSFPVHEMTVSELQEWVIATQQVGMDILMGPDGLKATPGEKQCKFCRAKGSCPELKKKVMSVATIDDFEDLTATEDTLALLTNEQLSRIAPNLELVHDWCNGIRAELDRRLLSGQMIEGWKVVQGKKGNRAWADPVEAEKALVDRLGEAAYTSKVISPTQAEKLLKKDYEAIKNLVTQPEGKPAVVPITDKRPALDLSLDFQPITE